MSDTRLPSIDEALRLAETMPDDLPEDFASENGLIVLASEVKRLRAELAAERELTNKLLHDPDYEGGVLHWVQKHDKRMLELAAAHECIRRRDEAAVLMRETLKNGIFPAVNQLLKDHSAALETDFVGLFRWSNACKAIDAALALTPESVAAEGKDAK